MMGKEVQNTTGNLVCYKTKDMNIWQVDIEVHINKLLYKKNEEWFLF